MTSEEIRLTRGRALDPRTEDCSDWWLKEIAYQLAVLNERNAKNDAEVVDMGALGMVRFPKDIK